MDTMRSAPALSNATLQALRDREFPFQCPRIDSVAVDEHQVVDAKSCQRTVVYIINAGSGGCRPAILHMHGGGFVAGGATNDIGRLQKLALDLDCVIATVDYSLAPEARWDKSLDENYGALKWLHDNARRFGVDSTRIAVMGESAGGGHAALLAIRARDLQEIPLVMQCLIYPMLDDRTGSQRQVPPHVGTLIWTAEDNRFGWRAFLGVDPGSDVVAPASVPARLEDFTGLPPTFIAVGSLDLFADESMDFAQRLNRAGSMTELIVIPGVFHGFDLIAPQSRVSRWFRRAMLDAFRRAFALPGDEKDDRF